MCNYVWVFGFLGGPPEGSERVIVEGVEVVLDEEDGEDDEEGGRSHTVGESHGIWWEELVIKEGV